MITLTNVTKSFLSAGERVEILRGVDLVIGRGEKVAITGPSGSGKTTLLSLIAGLDVPDSGTVAVAGRDLATLSKEELARFRNRTIGIVFQSFELIAPFTSFENVMTPQEIAGAVDRDAAEAGIASVGLAHRRDALPPTLSGGEKQRVAIARALIMNPPVLLADEPTGSLDRITGAKVVDLLLKKAEESGAALIVITHDPGISEKMDRVLELRDGRLYE